MPIIVKDFTWSQTESKISIKVPIRGVLKQKTDIFISYQYLKANFEQYFFEAILHESIDPDNACCTFVHNCIIFDLNKTCCNIWPRLELDLSKSEKLSFKQKCIQGEHVRLQEKSKKWQDAKWELKRVAVREQIELDRQAREKIEEIKKFEENKALGDLNEWKPVESKANIVDENDKLVKKSDNERNKSKKLPIKKQQPKKMPPIRSCQSLEVIFTPREFPTPSRESTLPEETEYLRKQAEARRSCGFISEDIRPEERNPQFLKAKGDDFVRQKNYLGAISAYTFGISISKKFVDLYIARSEVHLIVGNLNRAINDCTTALELMRPSVPANLNQRALCIGRRGMCLCKLGLKREGIGEIKASLKMVNNEELQRFLEEIEAENEEDKLKQQ